MSKMKKRIVYESELEQIPILFGNENERKIPKVIKARFETNSEEEDYQVDSSLLSEVKRSIAQTEDYKIDMRDIGYGRYGSVVHLSDKNKWTLDLITRHITSTTNQRSSITDVIDIFIKEATVSSHHFFARQKADDDKEYLMKNIRGLNQVFCLKDLDKLQDDASIADIKYKGNIIELFIPDMTFHIIDFFKALFLSVVEPDLLNIDEMILIYQIISFHYQANAEGVKEGAAFRFGFPDHDRKFFSSALKKKEINWSQIHSQAKIIYKEIAQYRKEVRKGRKFSEGEKQRRVGISQTPIKGNATEQSIIEKYTTEVSQIIRKNGFTDSFYPRIRIARSVVKNLSLIGSIDEESFAKIVKRFENLKQLSNYSGKIIFE